MSDCELGACIGPIPTQHSPDRTRHWAVDTTEREKLLLSLAVSLTPRTVPGETVLARTGVREESVQQERTLEGDRNDGEQCCGQKLLMNRDYGTQGNRIDGKI